MVNLIYIVLGTLAAGVGSVLVAALCARALLSAYTQHLLSLAAGALLATAFMHLLPEAFESGASPHQLFITLLVGLVFFFYSTRPSCGTMAMNMVTPTGMRTAMTTPRMTPRRGWPVLGRC